MPNPPSCYSKKIIIFDFDGVIADSFEIAYEVARLSRPSLTKETYKAKFNGNIGDAKHDDKKVKEIDFFFEYGKRFEDLGLDENIKNYIISLNKDYRLFIVSSTINSIIKKYLQRHGILDYFTDILGFDIEKSKVKKFKMIFDKYHISPCDVIFITDTLGDINEARAAGINIIIGILGGYQDEKTLRGAGIHAIVKDFNGFFELLKERNKIKSTVGTASNQSLQSQSLQ